MPSPVKRPVAPGPPSTELSKKTLDHAEKALKTIGDFPQEAHSVLAKKKLEQVVSCCKAGLAQQQAIAEKKAEKLRASGAAKVS